MEFCECHKVKSNDFLFQMVLHVTQKENLVGSVGLTASVRMVKIVIR